ncbi:hypothetical protein BEP19_14075 [Ammoniphilus oxalaticus]|uniref:Uncharacterized protein n=1 Tax=Ammoniphilus oxalaticus TaxID=66863 RepID=A0A419SEK2_9BACL|nr:hypothetical protein [Ammoniphilus oxalaticus]RKD21748.1 hypothetical protein BEP19_14075 [Ammoniphilus oxalaticus]
MKIFALHGPSGTGKSASALGLAHEHQIEAIIDDGLLIYHGKKIAGKSAKYENTTVAAVKRAIFLNKAHAEEVKQALRQYPVKRLLIIGTSKRMTRRIQQALELPEIDHFIDITEIRGPSEIRTARFHRGIQGKHLIPIPRVQVEQDLMHRLIAQVDKIFSAKKEELGETTIVHPPFQIGKIHISEQALKKIVIHSSNPFRSVAKINKVRLDFDHVPTAQVELSLTLRLEDNIPQVTAQIQAAIHDAFLRHLDLELEQTNIRITRIEFTASPKEVIN